MRFGGPILSCQLPPHVLRISDRRQQMIEIR